MGTSTIIQKKSLAEEVAEQLKGQIVKGKLKKGEKLPIETELMKIFGVGRSTIREAVKMLENMGYLKVQQGRGTFIEIPTPAKEPLEQRLKRADIRELNDVRKILESAIAERAALHHTEQDVEKMKKHLAARKDAAEAGLLNECIEADIKFHVSIAKATHNEILFELYSSVAIRLQKGYKHIYDDTSCFLQSQLLHENLVESIIANDKQVAANLGSLFWNDLHI
ncbi:FCD domain-containing protein [uncultured Bacteroides sp.]|uniref:FadR/GntR family transcriptional regulator n=1 Tax=uncultured Bacteroides sp. TaxID=162156 RepID=UPI0025FED9E9|nr:FCD domain-containing protein [uncultured Bacteroides sp.]